MRNAYSILIGKPEGNRPLGTPRRKWKITLEWILEKNRVGRYGMDECGSGYGPVAGCCEHSNETWGSIKRG
jgi:hypothetical protein